MTRYEMSRHGEHVAVRSFRSWVVKLGGFDTQVGIMPALSL